MSQSDFGTIDPNSKSGTQLASDLNAWRDALHSAHKGASAPSYAAAGSLWLDDTSNPSWTLKLYDGTDWIALGTVDTTANAYQTAGLTDAAHEYTKAQNFNATTLTDGANIAWNLESNQVASVTLAGNRTLDNPTNIKDGGTYILTVKQDGTGGRTLAYGTAYKWPGGTAPTLSTGASAVDILTFVSDGTSMFGIAQQDFS